MKTHGYDTSTGKRYEIAKKPEIDLTQLDEIQLCKLYQLLPGKKEYVQIHRDIFSRLEYLLGKFEAGEMLKDYQ